MEIGWLWSLISSWNHWHLDGACGAAASEPGRVLCLP